MIHGCIDGFSRKVIFMEASANNKAVTVSKKMRYAFLQYGVPAHLRIDRGVENRKVAVMMHLLRNDVHKPVIIGSSTRNQRIGKRIYSFHY